MHKDIVHADSPMEEQEPECEKRCRSKQSKVVDIHIPREPIVRQIYRRKEWQRRQPRKGSFGSKQFIP